VDDHRVWSHAIVSSVAAREEFTAAGTAMFHYFTDLVAAKRRSPSGDLVSALIEARVCQAFMQTSYIRAAGIETGVFAQSDFVNADHSQEIARCGRRSASARPSATSPTALPCTAF
jgi:hypothetical protein